MSELTDVCLFPSKNVIFLLLTIVLFLFYIVLEQSLTIYVGIINKLVYILV